MTYEYAAGLFDGEGCIQIFKSQSGKKKDRFALRLVLGIRNTHEGIIRELQASFGGSITYIRPKGKRAANWYWQIVSLSAETFLHGVLPYLRIKKPEAEIAIRFQETKQRSRGGVLTSLTKPELLYRQQLADQIKTLKKAYKIYET